jgi:hypothetical protein
MFCVGGGDVLLLAEDDGLLGGGLDEGELLDDGDELGLVDVVALAVGDPLAEEVGDPVGDVDPVGLALADHCTKSSPVGSVPI